MLILTIFQNLNRILFLSIILLFRWLLFVSLVYLLQNLLLHCTEALVFGEGHGVTGLAKFIWANLILLFCISTIFFCILLIFILVLILFQGLFIAALRKNGHVSLYVLNTINLQFHTSSNLIQLILLLILRLIRKTTTFITILITNLLPILSLTLRVQELGALLIKTRKALSKSHALETP